jgi:hypothetical protein
MKSLAEIELELRQLRRRVRELEGNGGAADAATVAALTDNSDEDMERQAGRGNWSRVASEACERARLSGENTREILRAKTGRDNG